VSLAADIRHAERLRTKRDQSPPCTAIHHHE
jgi:hypothetical protein